jgi:hypothetical protein
MILISPDLLNENNGWLAKSGFITTSIVTLRPFEMACKRKEVILMEEIRNENALPVGTGY